MDSCCELILNTHSKPCLIKGEYRQLVIRKLVGQRNCNAFLFMCFLFFPYPISLSRIIGIIFQILTPSFYISVFGSIIQSGIVLARFSVENEEARWTKFQLSGPKKTLEMAESHRKKVQHNLT